MDAYIASYGGGDKGEIAVGVARPEESVARELILSVRLTQSVLGVALDRRN